MSRIATQDDAAVTAPPRGVLGEGLRLGDADDEAEERCWTRFVTSREHEQAGVLEHPGRKASSALPDRSAKKAEIPMPMAAYTMKRGSPSAARGGREEASTTQAPATSSDVRSSCVTDHVSAKASVGTADSTAPRHPPMASESLSRRSSTVS